MKKFIRSILEANTALLIILFLFTAFCIDIATVDYVSNDKVWYKYKENKAEQKYKDDDEYISDFADDLKEIDLPEESSYSFDSFTVDAAYLVIPYGIVCLGLTIFLYIGFQFVEETKNINFFLILKSTTIAYFIFYIKDIISIIWFLGFKENYIFEDIQKFDEKMDFSLANFLPEEASKDWIYYMLSDLRVELIFYILLIATLLWICTKINFKKIVLSTFICFCVAFVFYQSLMIYIF